MTGTEHPVAGELTVRECLDALRTSRVARLGVIADGRPVVVPFGYVLDPRADSTALEAGGEGVRVFVRLSSEGLISRAEGPVCLELDAILEADGLAWSVLAGGRIRPTVPGELPDAFEGPVGDWRTIDVDSLSGRRFAARAAEPDSGFSVEWQVLG